MTSRRRYPSPRAARQAVDLAFSVPQVVAHRLARMAVATPVPSARDRREFLLMGSEKWAAFQEAWSAVLLESTLASWRFWLAAWSGRLPRSPGAAGARAHRTFAALLARGSAPYRRRAVANARRLRGVPLR
jgi:hypothetical protein